MTNVSVNHTAFMQRCLQLARLGAGNVAPNPMVGAVIVHEGRIIGEGWHREYGGPHAEVNAIESVAPEDRHFLQSATLFVSLEPCAHFGKTPPCADLVISQGIPRVVIGCRDPFGQVNGKGIEKLKAAGIEVTTGVLEKECRELNQRFFTFHEQHRPFILLKWAQTRDGKMASSSESGKPAVRLRISHPQTNRLVHKWRSEEMSILVGSNTAFHDDPELSTRLWPGKSPVRLVIDRDLRLPSFLNVFDGTIPTIVFNTRDHTVPDTWFNRYSIPAVHAPVRYGMADDSSVVHQVVQALYSLRIQSVMVEGGSLLLQSFIEEGLWDEARVIVNEEMEAGEGLPAPVLSNSRLIKTQKIQSDRVHFFQPLFPSTF